jgi:hypothetical protein
MIDQEQYTTHILSDFHMENCNSVKTPCPSYRLSTDMCPKNNEERLAAAKLPYCAIIGKVMYLSTCTCPDISFAVRELAKFMSNYGTKHFEATKHLLRYLQGSRGRGITYGNSPNPLPIFRSFINSDWAMSEGRKSVSGFVIECGNGPLTWSLKQQVVVALSSCEAEYLACSHCARQILWLCSLFHEIGFPQNQPTPLYCDNPRNGNLYPRPPIPLTDETHRHPRTLYPGLCQPPPHRCSPHSQHRQSFRPAHKTTHPTHTQQMA